MLPGLTGRLCLRGDGRAASQGGMEAMQTNRGVGSLATHPAAAKHFGEVGAACIICFYGSLCRHPRAVEPVLSLALGTARNPRPPSRS
jgi:hypothetical protein